MIKLLGAVLIVFTTTTFGFEIAKGYSNRTKNLRQFKFALQSLNAEIIYGHLPLSEVTKRIAKQIEDPLSKFFNEFSLRLQDESSSVSETWRECLDLIRYDASLKSTEYEVLVQFGETLGRHDIVSQQKHIILAMNHLDKEEVEAKESQQKNERMVRSLGFLSGVLIVLIIM